MPRTLKDITNIDELHEYAKENNLRQKKSENLILLFSPFETSSLNLNTEKYKSIIIEEDDNKSIGIVSVSYKRVQYNAMDLVKTFKNPTHCISYEGTCVNMFFHKGKWFLSTASFIDASKCFWKSDTKSIGDLFVECVKLDDKSTEESWDTFCSKHDEKKTYNYNLVHHENKHLIDYSYAFGPDYKKLCFLFSRDNQDQKIDTPVIKVQGYEDVIISNNLDSSEVAMLELRRMNEEQRDVLSIRNIKHEGIAVNDYENEICVKITSDAYTKYYCYDKIKNPGSAEHLISLYRMNLLGEYLTNFKEDGFHDGQSVLKMINTIFKSLAHDIWAIFGVLYDTDNNFSIVGNQSDMYKSLGKETKMTLSIIRGIFKKKKKLANEKFILPFLKSQSSQKIINLVLEQCNHKNSDHFRNYVNHYSKHIKLFLNLSV